MAKIDLKYHILKFIDSVGKPYNKTERNGKITHHDKCVCSLGGAKCENDYNDGTYPSIWKALTNQINREEDIYEGYEILRDDQKGLYETLNRMNVGDKEVIMRYGGYGSREKFQPQDPSQPSTYQKNVDLACINTEFNADIKKVIQQKNSDLIFSTTPSATTTPSPTLKPAKAMVKPKPRSHTLQQPIGSYFTVAFDDNIKDQTDEMWNLTETDNVETQTIQCLGDRDISTLQENGKTTFVKGDSGSVRAYARELRCPSDKVKVGSIHTHPSESQKQLLKGGIFDQPTHADVELTNEQSIIDLNLLIVSDDVMACTRSKQSITCFVNTTDKNPRELFKELLVKGNYAFDKQRVKGKMIDQGIRKFKKPFVGMQSKDKILCVESVDEKGSSKTECIDYNLRGVENIKEGIMNASGQVENVKKNKGQFLSTKISNGIHVTDVEVDSTPFVKINGDVKRMVSITPYSTDEVTCWEGYDGRIWCDGLRPLTNMKIHKDLIAPRFERRIWDVMYEKLDKDFTTTPLWTILQNYLVVLSISSKSNDVHKRSRIKGIMNDYEEQKDNNRFIRYMLPLIQLE